MQHDDNSNINMIMQITFIYSITFKADIKIMVALIFLSFEATAAGFPTKL